jgi:hypothetical protein
MDVLHAIDHNLSHFLQSFVSSHRSNSVTLNQNVALCQKFDSLERYESKMSMTGDGRLFRFVDEEALTLSVEPPGPRRRCRLFTNRSLFRIMFPILIISA